MMLSPDIDPGYKLLHDGAVELARIEANGMRVDMPYLNDAIERVETRIKKIKRQIREHKVGRAWRRKYGEKMKLGSREQLAAVLFLPKERGGLGMKPVSKDRTESGAIKMDAQSLEGLDIPFVKGYLKLEGLQKMRSTYLGGIRREVDYDGFLHPFFHLHTTQTFRSSSSTPNFQNMPIRNPKWGKLIRMCFIAREGNVIVETDFKGIEVGVAACYHKDPVMMKYINDVTKDMHRDMAMQIYCLTKEDWKKICELKQDKAIRHAAKNQFVFPEFYGDWYLTCGKCLWEEIERRGFLGPDGKSLYEHLAKHGITRLGRTEKNADGKYPTPQEGTFLKYVQEVENDFWNNRFMVYGKWKKKWYNKYVKDGHFDTYTGFRISGAMGRNAVINYPVQGAAFHCLLWSLIQINRELRRRKMKTKIVGQIHDSLVADVPVDEVDQYLAIVNAITGKRLRAQYPWINVPLIVECEIAPLGKSWYEKRPIDQVAPGQYKDKSGKVATASGLIEFWQQEELKQAA